MKARKIFSGLSALAMMAFAVGCSDDLHPDINGDGDNGGDNGPGVYMTVNIAMPSAKGTRSQTTDGGGSTDGTEIGQDSENKVEEVLIVLAEEDTKDGKKVQKFITSTKVNSDKLVKVGSATDEVYKTSSQFKKSVMLSYYNQLAQEGKLKDGVNPEVNVFVFCNPTAELLTFINSVEPKSTEWTEKTGKYIEKSEDNVIWSAGKFLMSNVSIATRQLPKTASDWNNYSTENTPFDLSGMNAAGRENQVDNYTGKGNVKVERTCARFDFRDGSLDGTEKDADKTKFNGVGNCTYNVVMDGNSDETDKPCLVQIQLGKMALVNMNKNYFFLRHVSDDGTEKDMELCGVERPWVFKTDGTVDESSNAGNYVVDAVSKWKNTDKPDGGFDDNLNYPFFKQKDGEWVVDNTDVSGDRWETYLITDVLADKEPNDKGGKYKIWRYGTETTVPGRTNQVNGISTGIVFKGKMIATENATGSSDFWRNKLGTAINDSENREGRSPYTDPILYSFGGHIYVTFEHMRRAALAAALTISWDDANNKWTYTVQRSNSLYRAVFGDGGFGTVEFNYTMTSGDNLNDQIMNEPTTEEKKGIIVDDLPVKEESAWYNWDKWNKANKPGPDKDKENGGLYGKMKEAIVDGAKITIYQSSYDEKLGGWGYYCYYYYWNRHNDNGNNNIMAPMEFNVVRNNVYKLAVTKISRLGHPRISENDPDRPTPGTPNESDDIYLTVQCEVLPWVVRINNIEF